MTAHIWAHPSPILLIIGANEGSSSEYQEIILVFFLKWVGTGFLLGTWQKLSGTLRWLWPELVRFWRLHLLEGEIWTRVTAKSWADTSASRDTKNRKKRMNTRLEDRTNPKITKKKKKKIGPASRPTPKTNRRDKERIIVKEECVMERKKRSPPSFWSQARYLNVSLMSLQGVLTWGRQTPSIGWH